MTEARQGYSPVVFPSDVGHANEGGEPGKTHRRCRRVIAPKEAAVRFPVVHRLYIS